MLILWATPHNLTDSMFFRLWWSPLHDESKIPQKHERYGCLCYVNLLFSVHSFYLNWQGYICINIHITIHYLPSSLNKAICALALTAVASTSLLLCHSLQATSRTIRISCSFCLQVGIAKLFFYHVGKSTFDYMFQQGVWCPYVFALIWIGGQALVQFWMFKAERNIGSRSEIGLSATLKVCRHCRSHWEWDTLSLTVWCAAIAPHPCNLIQAISLSKKKLSEWNQVQDVNL